MPPRRLRAGRYHGSDRAAGFAACGPIPYTSTSRPCVPVSLMRFALGIEYDGTDFHGWQVQQSGPSLQAELEKALSFVADAPVEVVCAGRTDAGVHGECQVVHFDTEAARPPRAWLLGANSRLPPTMAVRWVRGVADDFHARFSARARRYRYTLINRATRPALARRFSAWERLPLDVDAMQAASRCLIGEHDFTTFRTVACQAKSPVRSLHHLALARDGERVTMEIQANAFLHHMVRNIMGSLLDVGRGERPPEWIAELLAARDRTQAGVTAEARGLVFIGPRYPAEHGLPDEVCL
jgi:tRNA pseudouridine38-40 synthase